MNKKILAIISVVLVFAMLFGFAGCSSTTEEETTEEPETENENGKVGTFRIRIMFRQNSSWQGNITWLDGKMEESFRSVLELLILMDSALSSSVSG